MGFIKNNEFIESDTLIFFNTSKYIQHYHEKAKGVIMQEQSMTEQEAYDYIRRLSLDKHLSMRRVAEIILVKNGG